MLLHIEIVHIYLKKCKIIFQGKACKNKIGAGKTPGSVCCLSVREHFFANIYAKTNLPAIP